MIQNPHFLYSKLGKQALNSGNNRGIIPCSLHSLLLPWKAGLAAGRKYMYIVVSSLLPLITSTRRKFVSLAGSLASRFIPYFGFARLVPRAFSLPSSRPLLRVYSSFILNGRPSSAGVCRSPRFFILCLHSFSFGPGRILFLAEKLVSSGVWGLDPNIYSGLILLGKVLKPRRANVHHNHACRCKSPTCTTRWSTQRR